MTFPIPNAALDDRLAVVGTAGSGKTYLVLGAIEHLLARKSRVIGVDPLGVMWGLRLCADGQTPSPFQPVIFGGAHGDLPLNEHAGALVGETVATMRESCIIDLSSLGTKNAERRFMLAFLTALYRATDKEPVHLIIDEADMFAPQKLLDKEGDAAKLLGMMETVVRRGRVKGFIPWLITQRPAVLSKDVLSQADGLVALKLTASQDRKAIGAWVEDITASLRECAQLDWIDSTFAAATMREAADEIERLRTAISVSEKRAEELKEDLWRVAIERDDARASFGYAESERDSSQASLLRVEAWREMKDAPEIEGAEIIACNRKHGHRPCKFVWKGNPHVIGGIEFPVEKGWYAKGEPIMIRRSYQDDYVWVPLPRTALSPHTQKGAGG